MTDASPSAEKSAKVPTPPSELRHRIMSANVPKGEAEWWAAHEIERLEAALSASRQREANARAEGFAAGLERAAQECDAVVALFPSGGDQVDRLRRITAQDIASAIRRALPPAGAEREETGS